MFPEMMHLELHDWLPCHRKSKMSWFDNSGMDGSHRHFKHPLSFDVTEVMLALLSTQHAIPRKVLLQRVCPLGPMFMPDQASQIRMPAWNQSEHVANLALVPLGGMNMRRDGGE